MNMMTIDSHHIVEVKETEGGVYGKVIMLPAGPDRNEKEGTHLFDVPVQPDREELLACAAAALKGFKEG